MDVLTRGEVAQQANVHVETLRYYERRGLVSVPLRSVSNYRLYPKDTVRHVRFIKRAQDLGFSLGEIKELLSLRTSPKARSADVRAQAAAKITAIEEKIRALKAMKKTLSKLVTECSGRGPVAECPILGALDIGENP